jgi:quinol monooxygenase YgiN
MTYKEETLADHLKVETRIGNEISITGKWVPTKKGGLFRKSKESQEMIKEWEDIHEDARNHPGIISTEINHAIGQDAVLVHHIFKNEDALVDYFGSVASDHFQALTSVARPDIHLVRGVDLSEKAQDALASKNVNASLGTYLFGYVKDDYRQPDPAKAIQVTAKWTCKEGEDVNELIYWWQQVGTEAFSLEEGLVRFEVFRVIGENALIIHETFDSSDELKFHLTKGTAEKFKKDIDKIAYPENYFFRGPVSWMIRTYSKFMHLPATYSSQGRAYTQEGGTMSEGTIEKNESSNTSK